MVKERASNVGRASSTNQIWTDDEKRSYSYGMTEKCHIFTKRQ